MKDRDIILVVDDNGMNRELVISIMGKEYEFLEAENGEQAIELLSRHGKELSLVILDLVMPGISGQDVLAWMQRKNLTYRLPVIVLTADEKDATINDAYRLGACAYLCRPIQPPLLVHNAQLFIRTAKERVQQEERIRVLGREGDLGTLSRLVDRELSEGLGRNLPGGFFMYHADEKEELIYVNQATVEMFGCQTEEEFRQLVGNSFRGIVHPDDLRAVEAGIVNQINDRNGTFDYVEYRIVKKDGTIARVEDHGRYVYNAQYGFVYYVFIKELSDCCMGRRPRVLIVDDQELNRELLADILSDTYDVDEAAGGQEAMEILADRAAHYDMLLLDLIMPEPDGFAVLEFMNGRPELFSLPVIVISSDNSVSSINQAYHLGALDVISRPYNASHVKRRLRNSIELFRRDSQPLAGIVRKKILVAEASNLNRFFLTKILGDEYEIFSAGGAKEAQDIILAQQNELSLIILDLHMPEVNGYELLDWMKNRGLIYRIPVVAETVPGVYEENLHALYSGAADYITKPYRLELVKKRVAGVIDSYEMARLVHRMKYDELTGAYARKYFEYVLDKTLRENPEKEFDVVWTNISGFRLVNERYGIKTGDAVLRFMAEAVREKSDADLFARVSADHFLLVYEHGSCRIEQKLQGLSETMRDSHLLPGVPLSYGIYERVDKSLQTRQIFDRAMIACETAPLGEGAGIAYYTEELNSRMLREQHLVEQMDIALKENQFAVYYQPKFDLKTEKIVGMEALVRWIHPQDGCISPGVFVPLFENNGFIRQLDRYVLQRVCRDIKDWIARGLKVYPVSVNFSRRDFELEDYIHDGYEYICRSGVPLEMIHMEVTESMYSDNVERIISQVEHMRSGGIKVEMDDFGAGYSSLGMLTDMPLDVVKLDISFVRNIERKRKVIKSIIELSHGLGLEIVAEGVETEAQIQALRELSCDYVQGYYFARPMPCAELEKYLE